MSFRCLKSNVTVNYDTGADLGTTTTSTFFLPRTPIEYATVTGTIFDGAVAKQSFIIDDEGALQLTNLISNPTPRVSSGTLDVKTGILSLTWTAQPGANSAQVSYTGGNIYKTVTSRLFYTNCPRVNQLCNSFSNGYVAAVTVCNQRLYV